MPRAAHKRRPKSAQKHATDARSAGRPSQASAARSPATPGNGYGGRPEWLIAALLALAVFVVYAVTTPRTVTLEDDGLFIMASVNAGVAHPPGYPLYTLLGYVFSFLPLGSPALRIHLLSGLLGALACAVLFFIARRAGLNRWFAATVALGYGVSEHFWSQAIIAEVYTLNALLCLSVWWFCLRAMDKGAHTGKQLYWAALCFGLGLANHWPLMVLAFPAFFLLLLPRWRMALDRLPGLLGTALGVAGVLYAWMVWRSQQSGVISFYGPLESFKQFWYYLSRQGYGSVDVSPSAGLGDKWLFIQHFISEVWWLLTPVGAVLALAGLYHLWRKKDYILLAATTWVFLAHSLLLIMLLGFDYEFLNLAVFRPYPLVAYAMLTLWMGCGLALVWERARRFKPDAVAGRKAFAALPALALLLPIVVLAQNLHVNDRSDDDFAERYGRVLLEGLEPGAVLFVTGDLPTAPVGYLRYAAGVRTDVRVMNTQGLVYPTRLFVPPTTKKNETALNGGFVREQSLKRPVYYTTNIIDFPSPFGSVHYGLYRKVQRDGPPLQLRFDERALRYFEYLIQNPMPTDRWNRHLHDRLMQQYGEYIGYMVLSNASDSAWAAKRDNMARAMQNQYYGLIGMAEMLIKYGTEDRLVTVQHWLDKAEGHISHTLSKEMVGRHYYRRGYLAYRLKKFADARSLFLRSLRVHDHPDNPSRDAIKLLRPNNAKAAR